MLIHFPDPDQSSSPAGSDHYFPPRLQEAAPNENVLEQFSDASTIPMESGDSEPIIELSVTEFVELHKPQLTSSGVPERYWSTLYEKIKSENYDAGDYFQIILEDTADELDPTVADHKWKVIVYTEDGLDHHDSKHIYLIDHAWTFRVQEARKNLEEIPRLLERMALLMEVPDCESRDEKIEHVLEEMWRFNQTYCFGHFEKGTDESLPIWYIMDEFGSRIQHSDDASCRMVPFVYAPTQMAFTIMWPTKDLEHGDELNRNYVESIYDADIRKAKLLPWVPTDMTHIKYHQTEPELSFFTQVNGDSLPNLTMDFPQLPRDRSLKVFVDYGPIFNDHLTDARFELVESMSDADIIWTRRHYHDYKILSEEFPERMINQFPFEMVITVKDLLAIVSRRAVSRSKTEQPLESGPRWLPVTYNLTTELPQFVSYFQHRAAEGLDNHFICKPWNLARSLDTHITDNLNYIVRLPDTGPKIVCKYVENPVLFTREDIGDVKFDVRYVVLLSSVQPLKLYAYQVFWLRFANKPFSMDHFDDYEKHFTVMNYSETELKQIHYDDFIPMFEKQYPSYSWKNIEDDIFQMFREFFQAAVSESPPKGIGHSPQSRALYAVDLILKWETNNKGERYIQPVILECNFTPDCERACKYHPFFVNDVFSTLFLDDTEGKHVVLL